MKKSIREKIDKLKKQNEKQLEKKISDLVNKELGFEFKYKNNMLDIEEYRVTGIDIDEYNNLDCRIPKPIPIDILSKFWTVFNEVLENEDSYKHRTGIAFLINYIDQHYSSIDEKYLKAMIKLDESDTEKFDKGFKEWLIGDSYSTGGNFRRYFDYKINL